MLAEYECDICFDVLVGVHVLGEMEKKRFLARQHEGLANARLLCELVVV